MPSRSDQMHSYRFAVQRVVSALVAHETDPARSPLRRSGTALLAGVLVAALGVAGFVVWGLLRPGGSTRWRGGDAVLVERESGAKYVYLDRTLHPVANYASAVLVVGRPAVVTVARRSLAGVRRGVPLGIVGAPDSLPPRRDLVGGPWAVCSVAASSAPAAARSAVSAGVVPGGGGSLGAGSALLVSTSDGAVYLVWKGARAQVREPSVLLGMLVWGAPSPVSSGFVNALPVAADLRRVPVAGRGSPVAGVAGVAGLAGARVGQVFVVEGRQHAVALAGGLAPVTALQAALLLGDPQTVAVLGQKQATPLSAGEYAAAPKTVLPGAWNGLPDAVPSLVAVGPGVGVCAVARPGEGGLEVLVGARPGGGTPVVARSGPGPGLADEVSLPAGRAAVVEAMPAPDAPAGVVHLVTDRGVRHPVPSAEVLAMLGYGGVAPLRLPGEIVNLLPAGPALDPVAARTPLAG